MFMRPRRSRKCILGQDRNQARNRRNPVLEYLEERVLLSVTQETIDATLHTLENPIGQVIPPNPPGDNKYEIVGNFTSADDGSGNIVPLVASFVLDFPGGTHLQISMTSADTQIPYYISRALDTSGDTTILYSATGPGNGPLTTFVTPQDGTYQFNVGEVGQPPPDSPFTLTITDTGVPLQVSASKNDQATTSGNQFGSYLLGVPLNDTFTITSDDPRHLVSKISYSFDSSNQGTAQPGATPGTWQFTQNMGSLSANDNQLQVTAYGADGSVVGQYIGSVGIQNDLHETLKITPPGGPSGGEDVTGLRFLQGVALPSQFAGTITDLPSYYLPSLQIDLGTHALPGVTIAAAASGVTFAFSYDPAILTGDTNVFPVFTAPQGVAPAPGGDSTVKLHSVPLPDWMADNQASYDPAAQTYVINLTFPPEFQYTSQPTSGTPLGIFDGLTTSVGLGVHVTVTAPLTHNPGEAQLVVKDWFANMTFLGQPLIDKGTSLDPKYLHVTTQLDPDTLKAVDGIKITTDDISLLSLLTQPDLFDVSFGTGKKPFHVPTPSGFGADLSLNGELKAEASVLSVKAGLQIDVSGPTPTLVAAGTFVELKAQGRVSLVLNGGVDVGFTILPVPFLSFVAAGGVSAVADADIIVNFSGPIDNLTPSLNTDESTAGVTVGYGFDFNYAFLTKASTADLHPVIETLGPVALFGLNEPETPDFTFLNDLILAGPGNLTTPGKPLLGNVPVAPVPQIKAQSLQLAAVAPTGPVETLASDPTTSQLTVTTPVYATLNDLKFGLDVLADHATLTPGRHFLDVALVGSDGSCRAALPHRPLHGPPLGRHQPPGLRERLVDDRCPGLRLVARPGRALSDRVPTDDRSGRNRRDGRRNPRKPRDRPGHPEACGLEPGQRPDERTDRFRVGHHRDDSPGERRSGLPAGRTAISRRHGLLAAEPATSGGVRRAPGRVGRPDGGESRPGQLGQRHPSNHDRRPVSTILQPGADVRRVGWSGRPSARGDCRPRGQPGGPGPFDGDRDGPRPDGDLQPRPRCTGRGDDRPGTTGILNWTPTAPGRYTVTVRATDNGSPPLSDAQTFTITVNDVAPTVTLSPAVAVAQGAIFRDSGSFSSPVSGSFTATVDYGDGTGLQPLAVNSDRPFALAHTYARAGVFTVTVSVTDPFGGTGKQTLSETVTIPPPMAPPASGFGAGRDAFVSRLYHDDLNRLPEPHGLRFWSRTLARRAAPHTVARAIWLSREHRNLQSLHLAPSMAFAVPFRRHESRMGR